MMSAAEKEHKNPVKRKRCRNVAGKRTAKKRRAKKASTTTAKNLMIGLAAVASMMCPVAAVSLHSQTAKLPQASGVKPSNSQPASTPKPVKYVSATYAGTPIDFMEVGTMKASARPGGQRLPTDMDLQVPLYLVRVQDQLASKATTMYWSFTPRDSQVGDDTVFPLTIALTH